MNITIPHWAVPIIATIITWAVACLWPCRSTGGRYDFGAAFDASVHCFLAILATGVIWIAYLAIRLLLA